jgi:uncharacterized caspase-like protein
MSLRFLIKLAALASTCWFSVSQALAENRIALVIGNSNYTSVTALPNPANDAKAMTKFLGSAGFQVLQAPNLTQSDMRRTIGNFASMVAEKGPDTVALVFYAGHGLQVDGENFLVPVDAQIEREADVPLQSMRLADVMNALSSVPSRTRIVILDACRNNPFSAINKTAGRGLAIVDAPNGSLVSYSTAPGTEALDGDGKNSPFTTALMKIGQEPGLPIEQVLKRVRLDVSGASNRQQFPWESSSLTTEFSFFPAGTGQERPTAASAGQPSTTGISRSETRSVETWQKELKSKTLREAYEIVIGEDKIEAYQAYLALYPSQSMAPVVRTLLDRRQVMVAWYNAVTINTVASYQAFLAGYGNSDFDGTANRLVDRARTRSVSNATSAFASTASTCPCSQPTNPALRQKRTDATPAQNTGSNSANSPGTNVAVIDPTSVTVYTDPVSIVTPPQISIPVHPKSPRGNDKPEQTSGNDKPKSTGGSNNDNPQITRGRTNDNSRIQINNGTATNSVRSAKIGKSDSPSTSTGMGIRGASVVPRQSFGQMGITRNMSAGMPRMGFGRMGFMR